MSMFPRLRAARAEVAVLRYEVHRRDRSLAYQRARMKEMATESLGLRAQLAQASMVDTAVLDRAVR